MGLSFLGEKVDPRRTNDSQNEVASFCELGRKEGKGNQSRALGDKTASIYHLCRYSIRTRRSHGLSAALLGKPARTHTHIHTHTHTHTHHHNSKFEAKHTHIKSTILLGVLWFNLSVPRGYFGYTDTHQTSEVGVSALVSPPNLACTLVLVLSGMCRSIVAIVQPSGLFIYFKL